MYRHEQELSCRGIGYSRDPSGEIESCEIHIIRLGRVYSLWVGTSAYAAYIKEENAATADPALRQTERIFLIEADRLKDFPGLCTIITTEIPFPQLAPYLDELGVAADDHRD